MTNPKAEIAYTDMSNTTVTEYAVRDWTGDIVTSEKWTTPAEALADLHRMGYTLYSRDDVLVRKTTTTVTTTGWEAAQ